MDVRYNSVIHGRLQAAGAAADWKEMLGYLQGLSHSAFRTASYVLAERVLPELDAENYWSCFADIALLDRKAYLVTFLKAAVVLYKQNKIDFSDSRFLAFARQTALAEHSLDRQKTLKVLLPLLRTSEEVQAILTAFCDSRFDRQLGYLLSADESLPCYHAMFILLRRFEHDADTIERVLLHVLRRCTPLAFNFVSMSRSYFGVESLGARFSLVLQPYELSRIEAGYEGFAGIMRRLTS